MSNDTECLLTYLHEKMPQYPFDAKLDGDFVAELCQDFEHIDLLEETKAFRWYYDNEPVTRLRNVRLGLRRWIANAYNRKQSW